MLTARGWLRQSAFSLGSSTVMLIGSRNPPFKSYFGVQDGDGTERLLSVISLKDVNCILPLGSSQGKAVFASILSTLQHNYITPVIAADYMEKVQKAFIVRPLASKGSLKDLIFKVVRKMGVVIVSHTSSPEFRKTASSHFPRSMLELELPFRSVK